MNYFRFHGSNAVESKVVCSNFSSKLYCVWQTSALCKLLLNANHCAMETVAHGRYPPKMRIVLAGRPRVGTVDSRTPVKIPFDVEDLEI